MSDSKSSQYDEEVLKSLWERLNGHLHNYAYWTDNKPGTWDVTLYDISLLQQSYNSKRVAHNKLKQDIEVLVSIFGKQLDIKKGIENIRDSLQKIYKDADNIHFWENIAPGLNQAAIDQQLLKDSKKVVKTSKEVVQVNKDASLYDAARHIIDKEFETEYNSAYSNKKQKLSNDLPAPTSPSSSSPKSHNPTPIEQNINAVASSSSSSSSSVIEKTITSKIKKAAEDIFKKVITGTKISAHERKNMVNGLSSILDLADDSLFSQQLYFTTEEWNLMIGAYRNKHTIETISFPKQLLSTWTIVCEKIRKTRKIDSGITYIHQVYPKYIHNPAMFQPLKALETILCALDETSYLFEKKSTIDVTKYDYLGNIWLPLFRTLFKKSNIRIKSHVSAFHYTTDRKKEQYPELSNVVRFKVDVRFIIDYDGKEYDICSGEIAKMDDDDKIMSDRAKVNRESKDDLDSILEHCTDDEWVDRLAWQFQSSGPTAQLNTIHLCGNGLYVVLKRFNIVLPTTINELDVIIKVVTDLFSWSNDMYKAGDFLLSKIKEQHHISKGIETLSTTHHLLQRDATYSTPEKAIWRKPSNLYGHLPTSFSEKLLAAFHSSTSSISQPPESSTSSSTSSTQDLTFDSNGWARVGNQWYNCFLKEYCDESPYTED